MKSVVRGADRLRGISFRFPTRHRQELMVRTERGHRIYKLTKSQLRLLARQAVDAITK